MGNRDGVYLKQVIRIGYVCNIGHIQSAKLQWWVLRELLTAFLFFIFFSIKYGITVKANCSSYSVEQFAVNVLVECDCSEVENLTKFDNVKWDTVGIYSAAVVSNHWAMDRFWSVGHLVIF